MITNLHIQNVGIIENITINFKEGFQVLTGETGAGKTLIIGSLAILAGARFSKEMIRNGEEFSFIEANFYCPKHPLAIEGNIIVSREIYANGKNSCKMNGRLITVNELKETMSNMLDIHGQHDNQLLFSSVEQISYLDRFAGSQLSQLQQQYEELLQQYQMIQKELKGNYGDEQEKERRLDLLKYQLNEIQVAKLKQNEEEELESQKKLMLNSEKLQENLNNIDIQLNENAVNAISTSIKSLEKIEECGEIYQNKLTQLKDIYYNIQELAREFSCMKEDICFEEQEIEQIESRLDTIYSLKRKYGNSIKAIIEYQEKTKTEIENIENLEEHNTILKKQLENITKQMYTLCEQIHQIRKEYAELLSSKINQELKELEMNSANFKVQVEYKTNGEFTKQGLNKVEFLICTNAGEDHKQLTKIASGGEMARIMLAIKTVLSKVDEVPCLIFDEIDTGISGKASRAVAEKLKVIAKEHQVICITHLPAIAAKGDNNYYIAKQTVQNKTYTTIKELNEEEIIEEIARISSGDITQIAKEHAKELRKAI